MKRIINTLYITRHGAHISKEGMTLVIFADGERLLQIPVLTISGVVCFGGVSCTPPAMELCSEHGVIITFLSESGRFLGRVVGPVHGNVLLRREQYRIADDETRSAEIARMFIIGKICNSRQVLMRGARDRKDPQAVDDLKVASRRLIQNARHIKQGTPADELLGKEGDSAKTYFASFNNLITSSHQEFRFTGRSRRPPLDCVNAMLSFVYTLLSHDATAALESVGLDPFVGFFHKDRPGRPGLALDLMEEFRSILADRIVLSLINLQQVNPNGFTTTESGGITMDKDTRTTVISAYQKRKQEEIRHPFLNESMPAGLLIHAQALLLARHIRSDLDKYPPFFWK
jgi:CRISPR-associated protein Cas1